jgi:hypothetical protein
MMQKTKTVTMAVLIAIATVGTTGALISSVYAQVGSNPKGQCGFGSANPGGQFCGNPHVLTSESGNTVPPLPSCSSPVALEKPGIPTVNPGLPSNICVNRGH